MSRTPQDVQAEMLAIQPPGWTFPADPDTYWGAELLGFASEASLVEASLEAMLPQVDMRYAYQLLPDYQRVLGPDPCGRDIAALNFEDQAAIAYSRWTEGGTMCAGKLIGIAAALGVVATVQDSVGSIMGNMTCDQELVDVGGCFAIIVGLPSDNLGNCEMGVATCDDSIAPLTPSLAACPIEHAAPVHTSIYINYTAD